MNIWHRPSHCTCTCDMTWGLYCLNSSFAINNTYTYTSFFINYNANNYFNLTVLLLQRDRHASFSSPLYIPASFYDVYNCRHYDDYDPLYLLQAILLVAMPTQHKNSDNYMTVIIIKCNGIVSFCLFLIPPIHPFCSVLFLCIKIEQHNNNNYSNSSLLIDCTKRYKIVSL